MKKIWLIALACAALGTSACLITKDCTEIGCSDLVTIKLNGAEGAISGTVMVNGQPLEIKTTGCERGSSMCVTVEEEQIKIDTTHVLNKGIRRSEDITVTIDIMASADGVTRSASQTVMFQESRYYPNGEDCDDGCVDLSGTVTLQ